jgi:hypothetical protein
MTELYINENLQLIGNFRQNVSSREQSRIASIISQWECLALNGIAKSWIE